MRWDNGLRAWEARRRWHRWFAWRPVCVGYQWYWLEPVARKLLYDIYSYEPLDRIEALQKEDEVLRADRARRQRQLRERLLNDQPH